MISAVKYMTLAANTSTTGGSMWLAPDGCDGFSFTVKYVDLVAGVGAFKFFKSNDPRARQDHWDKANAVWTEFTADVAAQITNPASASAQFDVDVSGFKSDFVRMDYAATSGTLTSIDVWFSAHGTAAG
jgi:hypothetical protein